MQSWAVDSCGQESC